uniref:BPI1 domain-containing protein n=1 Tax=Panagrellus redivivus TaxID=6233 RepID=A0A7E4UTX0_PANRE
MILLIIMCALNVSFRFAQQKPHRPNMRILLISAVLFIASVVQGQQPPQQHVVTPSRPVQRGYLTNQRGPVPAGPVGGYQGGAGGPVGAVGGPVGAGFTPALDYNPLLAGGVRGYPGIRARINQRGFQYFSSLIAPVLDQEIKRARIPPISQCIPQVNGCIQVYNLYVSRYRCPQRVVVYPAPPNRLIIAVQNVDVGVTGNLGGQINILVPIQLFGIVQVNAHQVSITVELVVTRGPTGAPYIQVAGCTASVGYLDAYIENGGLIGDIANSQFRGQISQQVRSMLPEKLCAQIPQIVNSKINGQAGSIPQTIALTQMLQLAGGALGLGGGASGSQCAPQCKAAQKTQKQAEPIPAPAPTPVPTPPAPEEKPPLDPPPPPTYSASGSNAAVSNSKPASVSSPYATRHVRVVASGSTNLVNGPKIISNSPRLINSAGTHTRAKRAPTAQLPPRALAPKQAPVKTPRARAHGGGISYPGPQAVASYGAPQAGPLYPQVSRGGVAFPPPGAPNPCGGCANSGASDTLSQVQELTKYLDISKLNDIYLTVQLLQTYATSNDYTIDLNGEFSQGGLGGTPFGAFPMNFPYPVGGKMAEVLISDYTINSLFYTLHRKGFLSARLGPDTPKIGGLLKTTCSDDEDDELEDHGVEEEEEDARRRRARSHVMSAIRRFKRQDDDEDEEDGGLADLGICFGDILPAAREKYPNKNIVINVKTYRAPSVILSARNGGTAILDLIADADIYTEDNDRIGTIRVEATFEVQVRASANAISGHGEITNLKLTNPDQSLGLTQEALDNLGNLGKELVAKAANDVLEKGIPLSVPSGGSGLPLNFIAPEFHILEHAIHLEADFTISPSFLQTLGGGGGGGGVCRR